ncbi:MAG: hypothetical protein Q9170_007577 [Blastenia crenularia]
MPHVSLHPSPTTPPFGMKRKRSQSLHSTLSQIAPEELQSLRAELPTPQAPRSPSPGSEVLPLTIENLQRIPGSPPLHLHSPRTMSSPEKKSAGSTATYDLYKASLIMNRHGLFTKEGEAIPSVVQAAVKEVRMASFNKMRPESAQKIMKNFIEHRGRNEWSSFIPFWIKMYKSTAQKEDPTGAGKETFSDFEEQGLDIIYDQLFVQEDAFKIKCDNKADQEIIDAIPKVQTPKPDATFGVKAEVFTEQEMVVNTAWMRSAGIAKGIWHPFSLLEYKGDDGNFNLSVLQARAGGSRVVQANRKNRSEAGLLDLETPGIDVSTIAISFCISTTMAKMYVHYAEVSANSSHRTTYIMQEVERYWPDRQDGLTALRMDIERIFDWGTLNRLNGPGGVKATLKAYTDKLNKAKPKQSDQSNKAAKASEGASAGQSSRSSKYIL